VNHQDIADRYRSLDDEELAALKAEKARIERERQSLQELCGGMGHIYTKVENLLGDWFTIGSDGSSDSSEKRRAMPRRCAVCGRSEP